MVAHKVFAFLLLGVGFPVFGQSPGEARINPAPPAALAPTPVPALVLYSDSALESDGRAVAGEVSIAFWVFKDELGGEPLWSETHNVIADAAGRYSVQLGSSLPDGIPLGLFASGEARWLEVQVAGQTRQPRKLLVSVPYALKAADATTLGGLPASAYALAGGPSTNSPTTSRLPEATSPPVTATGGTANYLPVFSGTSTLTNSALYQSGTGTGAMVGIGTAKPGATLDVNGSAKVEGALTLAGTNQAFQWKPESAGAGTLNLLFGSGTSAPAETGLSVTNAGVINFVKSQPFPSAAITQVKAGTDMTGGGTSGIVTLNVDITKVVTGVQAGTGLKGGGTGGVPVLSLDTTKVVTGVKAGTGLVGGGTGGVPVLSLDATKIVTGVQAGAGLIGGGTGGVPVLSLDTTKVVTGVQAGPGLIGGGTGGVPVLSLDTTKVVTGVVAGTDMVGGGSRSMPVLNVDTTKVVTGVQAGTGLKGGGTGGVPVLSLDTTKVVTGVRAGTGLVGGGNGGVPVLSLDTTKVVTGVKAGTGLVGGGTGGVPVLSLDTSKFPIGVQAGAGLTSSVAAGTVTLSVDPTKVPLLATANTFAAPQTVSGNLNLTGGGGISINGDAAMTSDPRMVFSGFAVEVDCGFEKQLSIPAGACLRGFFSPDRAITITRVQLAVGHSATKVCGFVPTIQVYDYTRKTVLVTVNLAINAVTDDSGAVSVKVPAEDQLFLISNSWWSDTCDYGSLVYDVFVNVQYRMQ